MREKLHLLCINLISMPYIGGDEYNLIESDKVKIRFVHGQQQALTIYARMASLKNKNNGITTAET